MLPSILVVVRANNNTKLEQMHCLCTYKWSFLVFYLAFSHWFYTYQVLCVSCSIISIVPSQLRLAGELESANSHHHPTTFVILSSQSTQCSRIKFLEHRVLHLQARFRVRPARKQEIKQSDRHNTMGKNVSNNRRSTA